MNTHRFYWKRPPQLDEYVVLFMTVTIPLGLSIAWIWDFFFPWAENASAMDRYAMWLVVPLSWLLPLSLWLALARKRKQFTDHVPPLIVDEKGLSVNDWWGNPQHLSWQTFSYERAQRGGKDVILLRSGKVSGAISLSDLDQPANKIMAAIDQLSGLTR